MSVGSVNFAEIANFNVFGPVERQTRNLFDQDYSLKIYYISADYPVNFTPGTLKPHGSSCLPAWQRLRKFRVFCPHQRH